MTTTYTTVFIVLAARNYDIYNCIYSTRHSQLRYIQLYLWYSPLATTIYTTVFMVLATRNYDIYNCIYSTRHSQLRYIQLYL
jgi:hypothetical protein